MKKLKDEIINCRKCPLYKTRTMPVIGQGDHQAKLVFCGEAPGASEDKIGHPFCGSAGKILNQLLDSAGIKREDIYICNILKCRPPGNRNPQTTEIAACTPYLEKQIEIIKPKAICALGNYSAGFIMEKYGFKDEIQGISKIHGQIFKTKKGIVVIPLYHPAVVVYNRTMIKTLEQDFKILKEFTK